MFDLWASLGDETIFYLMTLQWNTPGLLSRSQMVATCSDNLLYLGGPGLQSAEGYIERTYTGFKSHDVLYFGTRVVIGGVWQASDTFSVQIDGRTLRKFNLGSSLTSFQTSTCGSSNTAVLLTSVGGTVFHKNDDVTVRFSWSSQTSSSISFGIKDFGMSFGTKNIK